MMYSQRIARTVFAAVFVMGAATPSLSEIIRDQFFDADALTPGRNVGLVVGGSQSIAQRFTVGMNGTLDSAALQVYRIPAAGNNPLIVEILDVGSRGVPTDVIASATVPADRVPRHLVPQPVRFVDVSFARHEIYVEPGDILAIALSSSTNSYLWSIGEGYEGGDEFFRFGDGSWRIGGSDLGFAMFVVDGIPEPSSVALMLVGAAAVLIGAGRRTASSKRS